MYEKVVFVILCRGMLSSDSWPRVYSTKELAEGDPLRVSGVAEVVLFDGHVI